jgi:hypothetical protein
MKIQIKWEVCDTFIGESKPQNRVFNTLDYDLTDEEWNNSTEVEKEQIIEDEVNADFDNKLWPNIIEWKELSNN